MVAAGLATMTLWNPPAFLIHISFLVPLTERFQLITPHPIRQLRMSVKFSIILSPILKHPPRPQLPATSLRFFLVGPYTAPVMSVAPQYYAKKANYIDTPILTFTRVLSS